MRTMHSATVASLYSGRLSVWDSLELAQVSSLERCPISEVVLYTSLCSWDSRRCPH